MKTRLRSRSTTTWREGVSLGQFLLAVDGHGKLAWQENVNEYDGVKSHIVEILTEAASNSYKAFLRKRASAI